MSVNHLGDRVRSDWVRSDCSWSRVISCACILLVDNNPALSFKKNCTMIWNESSDLVSVTTAGSAVMALKLFEARKGFYDNVMADFSMQDMDIFEFVRRIKDQNLGLMPIILMAEDYNTHLAEVALKNEASLFMEKPLIPSDIARLWHQILWITGRIPGSTLTKQKKRTLINSDDVNGKRRKSGNAQGRVTSTESRQKKTSNMRNEHGYYQAPSYLQGHHEGKSLHSNTLMTPPTRNFVCFTLEGVQQSVNELHSINALNGTTGNGIMMNNGSGQVGGENGGAQVLMGVTQVTTTNGYMTGALHVSNQEISGNLGRGIYADENIAINTGSGQVGWETVGGQIFMEGGEVTPTNSCVTGALRVPNQGAVVDLGRGLYGNGNGIIMNTRSGQVAPENEGVQIFMGGGQVTSRNGQEPLGDLANVVYHNEDFSINTGSGQVGVEAGGGQLFLEGRQVTRTNSCVTGALQVPNQGAVVDLGRRLYGNGNGIVMNTGSGRENGGVQIFIGGGQVNLTNGYVTGALHVPNQETLGDLANLVYHNGNVVRNRGSHQVGEQIGGRRIFMEGDQVTPTNGCMTGALQVSNQQAPGDMAREVYRHENFISNTERAQVGWEIGGVQNFMEGGQVMPTNGCVTGVLHVPNQEASGDLVEDIYYNENVLRNTGSGQVAEEIAGAQIFVEGDYQNTGQGIGTNPSDIAEKQLTDDDIDELLRELHEENTN